MTGKERIRRLFAGEETDRMGFWLGEPIPETLEIYYRYFGAVNRTELALKLNEDLVWKPFDFAWRSPDGRPMFDVFNGGSHMYDSQERIFTNCESVDEIANARWPNPAALDFDLLEKTIGDINDTGMALFGGMWSCFFHVVSDHFGMEEYFVKMYTNPEVVLEVTRRVVEFYLKSNRLIFERFAHKMDAFFMGNDFGTQLCLLIDPEMFRKFVLPAYKRLIDLAHEFGLKVMVHSCGAITRIIPMLIEAGIDGLHPLQALAAGMDADNLRKICEDNVLFMGGVDTQELLVNGSADDVRNEVRRLKRILGPRYVVSPSHEGVLPNVSPENIQAMWEEAMI